jgi:hypothetical protein
LKRTIVIGTALAALVGVGGAYGAGDFNSYTATATFSPSKAGSPANPSPLGMQQVWTANGNGGNEAGPLTRIVAKFYGMVGDGKDFPVCTAKMINDAGSTNGTWNKVCPKGSVIAQGPVESLFVAANTPGGPGAPCNPYLYIYNGGQGVQVDFFAEFPFAPGRQYTCAGGAVKTGSAAAYNVPVKRQGGYMVADAKLPPNVSTSAGGLTGVYASLIKYDLTFNKLTKKVRGKTVAYAASIACKNGKRPYSFTFYAQDYQGHSPSTQVTTISHTARC